MSETPTPIEEASDNEHTPDGAANSDHAGSDPSVDAAPASEAVVAPAGTVDVNELSGPPANSGFVHSETVTSHDVDSDSREVLDYLGAPEDKELAYTYVSHLDPNRQVDPNGIYLDDIDRRNAEIVRARIEDREPDLDNPPAVCSTPLVPTVVAQNQALPGVVAPVSTTEVVSVGVAEDDLTGNSAAAEAQGRNPDGSKRDEATTE